MKLWSRGSRSLGRRRSCRNDRCEGDEGEVRANGDTALSERPLVVNDALAVKFELEDWRRLSRWASCYLSRSAQYSNGRGSTITSSNQPSTDNVALFDSATNATLQIARAAGVVSDLNTVITVSTGLQAAIVGAGIDRQEGHVVRRAIYMALDLEKALVCLDQSAIVGLARERSA
jgi:hypothetical protein